MVQDEELYSIISLKHHTNFHHTIVTQSLPFPSATFDSERDQSWSYDSFLLSRKGWKQYATSFLLSLLYHLFFFFYSFISSPLSRFTLSRPTFRVYVTFYLHVRILPELVVSLSISYHFTQIWMREHPCLQFFNSPPLDCHRRDVVHSCTDKSLQLPTFPVPCGKNGRFLV